MKPMKLNRIAGAALLLTGALCAQAQSTDTAQRVEITGSSIKRIASEGALPVQVFTRQDLDRQGIVTAEQLISSLNGNGTGLDNLASNADVVAGAARGMNGLSAANLRGQGSASTLVLLNGRRVAAHGLNGGVVDLNSIPMAAVDRVEVLKDGASAIYGTDAIGGVINFILRKNFNGLQVQAFTDITQHGGGNITRANVTGGFGDLDKDKRNLLFALSHSENTALRGDQRDFVNTFQPNRGLSVDTRGTPIATVFPLSSLWTAISNKSSTGPTQPGTTQSMGGGINVLDLPGGAGCSSVDGMAPYDEVLWAVPTAKWACAWDTGRAAVLQQPVKNTNLVARGTLRFGEHQAYAEFTAARVESAKTFSANQISSSTSSSSVFYNLAYPSTGTSYTDVFNKLVAVFPTIEANRGQPLAFRWRCMPCGPREIDTTSETQRFMVGAEGPLSVLKNWDYRVGMSTASSDTSSVLGNGYFYGKEFADLIKAGTLNPFSLTQTDAALSALKAISANGAKLYGGQFTLTQADAMATGPLFKLPAGEVMAAVGADLRQEKYKFNGNETDLATQARIYNAPFDSINTMDTVKRDIRAAFAEVLVPVVKGMEITGAVRHDNYTGFGGTTNPKVSLRFTPVDQLLVRGSYGTGFRVPTFNQLFFGVTESPYSGKDLVDPGKCPTLKVSTTAGCESITPTILTGGKLGLGPEEAKQSTVGFVFAPNANFSAGADWWTIRRTGTIQSLSLTDLVNNYALFTDNFIRDASGVLTKIDQRWVNAGQTVTTGVDVNARASTKAMGATWGVLLDGSYLLEKKSRLIASAPFGASEIAVFSRAGDLGLRWKHTLTGTYSRGNWMGMLTQIYRSGYKDYVLPGVANGSITPPDWNPNVAAYTVYNASVTYTGVKNTGLTFGIKNLFDKAPPFAAAYDSNTGAGSSWEPRVADPRLRSFTMTVDYKFF